MACESFQMRIAQAVLAQRADGLDQIVQAGAEAAAAAALEDREYFGLGELACVVLSITAHDERECRDERAFFGVWHSTDNRASAVRTNP